MPYMHKVEPYSRSVVKQGCLFQNISKLGNSVKAEFCMLLYSFEEWDPVIFNEIHSARNKPQRLVCPGHVQLHH